jgi:hypothetical protein
MKRDSSDFWLVILLAFIFTVALLGCFSPQKPTVAPYTFKVHPDIPVCETPKSPKIDHRYNSRQPAFADV